MNIKSNGVKSTTFTGRIKEHGNSARAPCPREYLGKEYILTILKDSEVKNRD
ncbi:DUF2080 family transposase-associated protein [Methanococcus maripaludis]|uniref:Putative transposon-encoded protein n=1 Tax=Methanococcus maripaludis TaxID=39152 RepID=A0A7J9PKI4_METMI|nr:DUF2080 family transposase-associated protein [Methanococcus maripaludis]MBA2862049.1 putative transposon-encoded protein [Methanococcus maripaludis]